MHLDPWLGFRWKRASMRRETRARVGNIAWLWTINSKEDEGEGPIRKENAREIPNRYRLSIPSLRSTLVRMSVQIFPSREDGKLIKRTSANNTRVTDGARHFVSFRFVSRKGHTGIKVRKTYFLHLEH